MNETPKAKKGWRILRRISIGLGILITLVAVLVTEEDWRGKRAWENYKRQAEARGEKFDWSAFAPTNVPDDQNFAKAPIFSGLMAMVWDEQTQDWKPGTTNAVDRLKMSSNRGDGSSPAGEGGAWDRARLTRLENWQDYYRNAATNGAGEFPVAPQIQSPATDVLLALSKHDSAIEELRAASRRPYSQFGECSYGDAKQFSLMLKYLSGLKGCSQVLQLRAIAELADDRSAPALDDVQLLLRLDDALQQEPLLIEHLVSLAITAITLQPIYEGLAQHRWNDAQLAEVESALAEKDFLADYQRAMQGERIYAIDLIENQRITGEYKTVEVHDGKPQEVTVNLHLMPGAFFYQNELALARLQEQFLLPLVDLTNRIVSPAAVRQAAAAVQAQTKHFSPYKLEALMVFPAISKSVMKFAYIQSSVDLARVACALERHRLAHGEYPENLGALAPQFIDKLPHDIIGGPPSQSSGAASQPLHYRRTDDGKFLLYSVGWNETDDGGVVGIAQNGKSPDWENGDWVWQYPAK